MNRRGLLGMFAAGIGATILPSGIVMPVRALRSTEDFRLLSLEGAFIADYRLQKDDDRFRGIEGIEEGFVGRARYTRVGRIVIISGSFALGDTQPSRHEILQMCKSVFDGS
jgi:hypothetical protein